MSGEDLTTSELTYLNIDPRAYRYIRETAVKNIYDASVELITNSVDAYRSPFFNPTNNKSINIILDAQKGQLHMIDNAIGLSGEKMAAYFLTVGQYTSQSQNRGFFSRGVKDLCAIGDCLYTTVENGKISQALINTHGQGQMLKFNQDVTDEERLQYGILADRNGLHGQITFKQTFSYDEETYIDNLLLHYAIRDIFADMEFELNFKLIKKDGTVDQRDLVYHRPSAHKIVSLDYALDSYGYVGVNASFELYQMDEPVQEHYDDDMRFNEYGILINSGNAVHDNTAIHYTLRNNPNIRRLYGRITCSYINDLMYQLESDEPYNELLNPRPIINPSRQDGLDSKHPFTKALYDVPYKRLLFVLTDLEDNNPTDTLQPNDISDVVNSLEVMGTNIVNQLNSNYTNFVVRERLVRAVSNDVVNHNIQEDGSLKYSKERIDDQLILDTEGDQVVRPKFIIRFSKKPMTYKYQIYKDFKSMIMIISLNAVGIKDHVQEIAGEIIGLNNMSVRILLANMITEGFGRIIGENQLENVNLAEYDFRRLFRKFELIVTSIEENVYNILVKNTSGFSSLSISNVT